MTTDHPKNQFYKLLIVLCFGMLSMLTWASSPMQVLVEKVQHKETIKAKGKACREMLALSSTYTDYVERMFVSGCLWETRNYLLETKPKYAEQIEKDFNDQESKLFEVAKNHCVDGGFAYQKEGKIKEEIVSDLSEKFDCENVFVEMKKLGITGEDLDKK